MTVNYNKQMIDLVRELRKHAPSEAKPGIKLANPDLLEDLLPWYHSTKDAIVKALVKELFAQAGDDWVKRLAPADTARVQPSSATHSNVLEVDGKRYVTKVYRGQTQLVEVPSMATENTVTQRVYRGQVVR